MNNTHTYIIEEGVFDRLKTKFAGAKTAAQNIKGGIGSIAKGHTPTNLKNVSDEKVKYRFKSTQQKVDSLLGKMRVDVNALPDTDLDYDSLVNSKLSLQVEINKEIVDFVNDIAKELGLRPREVLPILNASYKDIYSFIAKSHIGYTGKSKTSGVTPGKAGPSMGANVNIPYKTTYPPAKPPAIPTSKKKPSVGRTVPVATIKPNPPTTKKAPLKWNTSRIPEATDISNYTEFFLGE